MAGGCRQVSEGKLQPCWQSPCQCIALLYGAVQCIAVLYSAGPYGAVQCSVMQCSAVQCDTVQCSVMQCGAVSVSLGRQDAGDTVIGLCQAAARNYHSIRFTYGRQPDLGPHNSVSWRGGRGQ